MEQSFYEEAFDAANFSEEELEQFEQFEQFGEMDLEGVGDVQEEAEEEKVGAFDPRVEQDVIGLLYLGYLEDEFSLLGHEFKIRTLRIGEELAVANLVRDYQDVPLAQGRAYATAVVAGALVLVDGHSLYRPLARDEDFAKALPAKHKQVTKWFWPLIEKVYQRYVELERRQITALQELEGALKV